MPGFIKLLGFVFIILSTSGAGIVAASVLSGRVRALEQAQAVLEGLAGELSYGLSPLNEAAERLLQRDALKSALYLKQCSQLCMCGVPFPEAWRQGVAEGRQAFSEQDTQALSDLSDVLGQTDLEGQLSALSRTQKLLMVSLERARNEATVQGKLYRTLGMLGGVFLVIFLI